MTTTQSTNNTSQNMASLGIATQQQSFGNNNPSIQIMSLQPQNQFQSTTNFHQTNNNQNKQMVKKPVRKNLLFRRTQNFMEVENPAVTSTTNDRKNSRHLDLPLFDKDDECVL